ncbi:MAG: hypothetical protein LUD29_05885 [Clostridia bacterium]|nr:hypothetical protein [Clostridia bacterium]
MHDSQMRRYWRLIPTAAVSERTIINYAEAKKLYIIEAIPAWGPALRCKTTNMASPGHSF